MAMDPYQDDPAYKAKCENLHFQALESGQSHYLDPQTGLRVSTSAALLKRGYCCNLKCRHCPYSNPRDYERYVPLLKK